MGSAEKAQGSSVLLRAETREPACVWLPRVVKTVLSGEELLVCVFTHSNNTGLKREQSAGKLERTDDRALFRRIPSNPRREQEPRTQAALTAHNPWQSDPAKVLHLTGCAHCIVVVYWYYIMRVLCMNPNKVLSAGY